MNRTILLPMTLALGLAAAAFGQASGQKIGAISLRAAMENTQEGQKASSELQLRYDPIRKDLEKKQAEIQTLRDQLNRGSNTMNEKAREALVRDIENRTKNWNRDQEDAAADFQVDLERIQQELYAKMQVVIDKYARDNGYAVIIDISTEDSPVVYISNTVDITNDIIALYDKNAPVPAAAKPPAAPAAKPPAASPPKK